MEFICKHTENSGAALNKQYCQRVCFTEQSDVITCTKAELQRGRVARWD